LPVEAKLLGREPAPLAAKLDAARRKLFVARSNRVRPGRDEKVLTAWNSLAIDALARAGKALDEPRYTAAANSAADFLCRHLSRGDGRLLHYWRNGLAKGDAYLDDYAALGNALLTLHETAGSLMRLDQAAALADTIVAQFADQQRGGFFYTAAQHEPLIVRKKDWLDNPAPSGNGLAATLLLRLQAFDTGVRQTFLSAQETGGNRADRNVRPSGDYAAASPRVLRNAAYRTAAEGTIRACMGWVQQMPTGAFQLLLARDVYK
jgi:uncharacterized protein